MDLLEVNKKTCNKDGICAADCPAGLINFQKDQYPESVAEAEELCTRCGHCVAVCPVDAVKVTVLEDTALDFSTFEVDKKWLPHGEFDLSSLVKLMGSRRTCRNFKDQQIDLNILEDLIKIGITAPSGTNSQKWTFSIIAERQSILVLGEMIAKFFKRINRLAENIFLRKTSRRGRKILG